jgi:NAD(P)-dependent dehydrogenase (short-subunit alcohol dehydrogenase family)
MSSSDPHPLTVVITGVTRGLGRAMADEFVRLGHRVLGCARTQEHIEELSRAYPGHDFQVVDVASDAEVEVWARRLTGEHRPLDLVLNNAAILSPKAWLWEVGDREFSREIDTNIKGVVNVIRHFTPSMISRKRGVIVNLTSRWGRRVEEQMAPYCATKWAVVAITKALAKELAPNGVAVVGLNPGVVRTGMLQRYLGDAAPGEGSGYPTPSDWAKIAVPFIMSFGLKDTGKVRSVFRVGQGPRFIRVA